MSRACSTCGSSDIDFDPSRGDTVCTNCGSVLEEGAIVSEVGFQETSAGGTSVIGQFVSNEGNKVGQGLGFRPGYGRESRTVTLENGKRRLQALANQLQLNNHCIESAYMFFKLAVSKRLTKGRRTNHIAAACLYLVCRTEKTPRILWTLSCAHDI
ncbi:transcription factor IIIB 90 kDa subunit-like [Paramuricea clavata]|uniref:Transcription factor IIIB 90 kDa subunit-like n=1 Tax=Paramuricea clavata TaxID=317549 RepID=A0A7D9EJN3_PARCT|nr:transcription factor IIIB 90 kDa subunit-like [Paramuricea clavata]